MGSACLTKAKLGVLPDHIRPAAEPGPVAAQGQVLVLTAGTPRTPWGAGSPHRSLSWPLLLV